jgi:predicted AlkP superfamily pyrophosphatase or phosphodiesterase
MKKGVVLLLSAILVFNFPGAKTMRFRMTKPKLIIGIVVDQMRYDLLWRFWDQYSEGGFSDWWARASFALMPAIIIFLTTTAPGHSTIYTGTTPALHGIVDNYWYDRKTGKSTYCATDSSLNQLEIR